MKTPKFTLLLVLISLFLIGCNKSDDKAQVTLAAAVTTVAYNISPPPFNEDVQSKITLNYSGDKASSCTVTNLNNIKITKSCSCYRGVCTVTVSGNTNYNGPGSFNYSVKTRYGTSNVALASLTINPVNDLPVAQNISPAAFDANTQSIISLSYYDVDGDQASSCSVFSLVNASVTQACACASGACTVGITGAANYSGPASFAFRVTANNQTSNSATASLTINPVIINQPPVANNISPAAFNEDTQGLITLSYSSSTGDATSCSVSNLVNVTQTQACSCNSGICSVGVTGNANFNGPASFSYTVTANGLTSNSANAALTIISVNDAPIAYNLTPAAFDEDSATTIALSYSDVDFDQASSCSLSSLNNVEIVSPCSCNLGSCSVTIKGTQNYSGLASFAYSIVANNQTSNTAIASLTINEVADAPIAYNISPAAFAEDSESLITLNYNQSTDLQATSCSVSNLNHLILTRPCECTNGLCTVGVSGDGNYFGAASFSYSVTANAQVSNSASASLSIFSVDDAPVVSDITSSSIQSGSQGVVALTYSDVEADQATSCTVANPVHVSISQPCSCVSGSCSVGITAESNYNGPASFSYNIIANSSSSNMATVNFSVTLVSTGGSRLVSLFPSQNLILPSDAVPGDMVSDISSNFKIFHNANPTYQLVNNSANNNFSLSSSGVLTVSSTTGLVAGQAVALTVRAEDSSKGIYDEKVVNIEVISSANIIYIDPGFTGTKNGSRSNPYSTWAEARAVMTSNKYLLQKRGTTSNLATFDFNLSAVSNVTLGAYGSGARPILNFSTTGKAIDTSGRTGITIRDLHIKGNTASTILVYVRENTKFAKFLNSKFEGGGWSLRLISSQDVLIQNNELSGTADDGIYTNIATGFPNLDNIEMSYNYIHHVNQNYVGPGTSQTIAAGDGIQFNGTVEDVSVHHNIIDRSDSGNKFCLIMSPRTHDVRGQFNYNYCKANNQVSSTTNNPVTGFYFENVLMSGANPNALEIIGNKFVDVNYGLFMRDWTSIKAHSNEFVDTFIAIRFGTDTGGEIYNNLFKNITTYAVLFGETSIAKVNSKNNIFDVASTVTIYSGSPLSRLTSSNHNLFANSTTISGYPSLSSWQSTGNDLDSVIAAPQYHDQINKDYHQVNSSPAAYLGEDLFLNKDIEEQDFPASPVAGPYQTLK